MSVRLKLESEYHCFPIWGQDSEYPDLSDIPQYGWTDEIDPADLPLSQATIDRLNAWQDIYDKTFNEEYPSEPFEWSKQEQEFYETEGISLWEQLQKELGHEYKVFYKRENNSLSKYPIEAVQRS